MCKQASGEQEIAVAEIPEGPDLSNAVLGDGPELTPQGVHADGTLCFHGIAEDAPVVNTPGRWRVCKDGQDTQVEGFSGAESARDGWFLVPTPCPECGEAGSVEVCRAPALRLPEGAMLESEQYEFRCTTCKATGAAAPKPGVQISEEPQS